MKLNPLRLLNAAKQKPVIVTFEGNGADNKTHSQTVSMGDKLQRPANPVYKGHTFDGWYRDNATFNAPWNFATDAAVSDITLYAKWQPFTPWAQHHKHPHHTIHRNKHRHHPIHHHRMRMKSEE